MLSKLSRFGVTQKLLSSEMLKYCEMSNIVNAATRGCFSRKFLLERLIPLVALVITLRSAIWASVPVTLTSLHAIHSLTNTEASRTIPVAFEATVVYSRGYESLLFVQDGDDAFFVSPPTTVALLPGDRIFIKGKTQGSFRPLVVASSIMLLHHGSLPDPQAATFDELIRAQYDSRLVTVRAIVRASDLVENVAAQRRSARLQLVTEDGHIEANVDSDNERALKGLLDDEVEITGVAAGKFDNKMQQTGVVLYVSNLAHVKALKRVNTRFGSLPITPMDQILSNYHVRDQSGRDQVRGTITYYQPGSAAVLQDGSKSLWISTHTREPLQIGNYAEASGFPDAHDRMLMLTDSEIEDVHIAAPIAPQPATWRQLAFWNSNQPDGHQYDLVSTEGQIVTEVREATQDEYVLTVDGKLFNAIYRHPPGGFTPPPMRQIPIGTRVRVTGICRILDTEAINPGEEVPFDILLRNFDDIVVLAGPPLLNIHNLTMLVCLLLLLLFVAAAREWIVERKLGLQNADSAYIERQRSMIMEDINGSRPLAEIIEHVTELASFKLRGAPCWCQLTDGAQLGKVPSKQEAFRIVAEQIPARSGPPLGFFYAAFHPRTKPISSESEGLSTAASMATLAIESRRLFSDLQHRSKFDLLTDIHNRFSMEIYLDEQIERAREDASMFGLIYIDLNDFKQVNDVYGHRVGDYYLQEAATRMKHQLREDDMLARLGGDEFAVLVSRVHNRGQVDEVARRLERSFEAPFAFDGYVIHGSASIGLAIYPADGTTRESLLSAADAAMYVVKQTKKQSGRMPLEESAIISKRDHVQDAESAHLAM
jgi:diguanylate cyclase (GGDEF)-like protein